MTDSSRRVIDDRRRIGSRQRSTIRHDIIEKPNGPTRQTGRLEWQLDWTVM